MHTYLAFIIVSEARKEEGTHIVNRIIDILGYIKLIRQ